MASSEWPQIVWKRPGFAIGLTGAVGSGKSTAGRVFEECGARLLNADLEARDVLHSAELRGPLVEAFGESILGETGDVVREKLADLVFENPESKQRLEDMIHPAVRRRYREARDALGPGEILVYDVPLLFEAGLEADFDLVITVSAPEEQRLERVKARSNWDENEWRRREAAQLPLSEKEKRADLIIRNDHSPAALKATVRDLYKTIQNAGPREQP